MIKKFEEFVNENSAQQKSLAKFDCFETTEEIIEAIERCGFEQLPIDAKHRSCDFIFINPKTKMKYISFTTGYVRTNVPTTEWRTGKPITSKTPLMKNKLALRERLLMILRRAMKTYFPRDVFNDMMSSNLDIKTFLHDNRGKLSGSKFGF